MKVRATAIGWRAQAALDATGGHARVIAALSGSCYADADGELIWLGPGDRAVHARAVMTAAPIAAGTVVDVASVGLVPWRAARLPARRLPDGACLDAMKSVPGTPRGLGRLLLPGGDAGRDDPVVERARPYALGLAAACAADDPVSAVEPARALLGLGDGLTPSGDDYVGGMLFAIAATGRATALWSQARARIVGEAGTRTHPVSARLLADLAAGEGWSSLHDLVDAMAAADADGVTTGVRRLVALGASSGWDLLAGFLAGIRGRLCP